MVGEVNGLVAATDTFVYKFSVTQGGHSSNKDRFDIYIPKGTPVDILLKNITTSNTGNSNLYVMYKGESTTTNIASISFDTKKRITIEEDVVSFGFYWNSTTGSSTGDVQVEVTTYSASRKYEYNSKNIFAYVQANSDIEWTIGNSKVVTIGNNVVIKNQFGDSSTIQLATILQAAAAATGFSVSDGKITFPSTGTMYYDMETGTIGFVNNITICRDPRYIALFENGSSSYVCGLLVDYSLNRKYKDIIKIPSIEQDITNQQNEIDNLNLLIDKVSVQLSTASSGSKFYAITLKRGNYSVTNTGTASISSFYLSTSVSPDSGRVQELGGMVAGATVNFTVDRDDIVCVNGWWPATTQFDIIYNDGRIKENIAELQDIVKTKRNFTLVGNDETAVDLQFVVKGNSKYRIIPNRTLWPVATNTKYSYFAFYVIVNDVTVYNRVIAKNTAVFTALDEYIDVDIPDLNNSSIIRVGIRALSEEEVSFELIDITSLEPILSENSLFVNNPDKEFESKVKTLKKQTPYGFNRVNTPLVLMWFSDLHHYLDNLDRINMWKNKYAQYIDDVLNTGDTINDNLSSYDNDMDAYFEDYGGDDILLAIGNHDVTSPNSSTKAWDGTQSITDMYNKYIGRMDISGLGIVQPSGAAENGYCYYYKDYQGLGISTSGIRLIVIDSCITNATYQTEQVAWFITTLADAKTLGYSVLVASHYMPGGCDEFDDAKGFCYWVKQYRGGGPAGNVSVDSRFITAIDDFINGGGNFVTWLCGHSHADHVGTVPSHNNQMVIAITSASANSYNPIDVMPVRVGKAQDAFDMIEVDTYYKQVKLVRVGYNVDALGREINMITLDYQNKKVVI